MVGLQSPQVSCMSIMHGRFYESSKLKKCIYEPCMFSLIWSQTHTHITIHPFLLGFANMHIHKCDRAHREGFNINMNRYSYILHNTCCIDQIVATVVNSY